MNKLFANPHQRPRNTTTLYLIGDDGADKQALYSHLGLSPPQESPQLSVSIHQTGSDDFVQVYDFSTDKMLRPALQLYLNILPPPTVVLYFLQNDSTGRQIQQWITTLRLTHLRSRVVFVSDVSSYLERDKMIVRVGREFDYPIVENMCFSRLDPVCFDKMMANIEVIGIVLATALCLRPSLRQRVIESWQGLGRRASKIFRRCRRKANDEKSIV